MTSKGRCFRDRRRTARRQERQRAIHAWWARFNSVLPWEHLSEIAKHRITVAYNDARHPPRFRPDTTAPNFHPLPWTELQRGPP